MDVFMPIQIFADWVVKTLGLQSDSYLGSALNFFIYDVIKIGLLLVLINYLMAIVRYYLPVEKIRNLLASRKWYGMDYLLAAILGMITPFCSCSSIPLFIGFLSAGIPLGVTFTFLIASPLINEASLILFPAMFGIQTTIIYNLIGVLVSIAGGIIIQKLNLIRYVNPEFLKFKSRRDLEKGSDNKKVSLKKLIKFWWDDGFKITKSIFLYVVIGIAVGALIHGFVPMDIIDKYLSSRELWVVPVATLAGVPLYANSVSVLPIAEALITKGVPLGTVLSFMTATVTLSIPEAFMLKKVMNWRLLAVFFGITIVGIMLLGYVFNILNY